MGGDQPCQQGGVMIGAAKNIRSDKSGQRKKEKGKGRGWGVGTGRKAAIYSGGKEKYK